MAVYFVDILLFLELFITGKTRLRTQFLKTEFIQAMALGAKDSSNLWAILFVVIMRALVSGILHKSTVLVDKSVN